MFKLMLAAALPIQGLVQRQLPTHRFINQQALAILKADDRQAEAVWLEANFPAFCEGCDWADTGWKNTGHMYDPTLGRGFTGWKSAPELAADYWAQALEAQQQRNENLTAFYLGAAAHLVQDLCVPHHAAAKLDGHLLFEAYATRYRHRFTAHTGGLYNLANSAANWVIQNAQYARAHYRFCLVPDLRPSAIQRAVTDLLPRAQRTTAGFVASFLRTSEVA